MRNQWFAAKRQQRLGAAHPRAFAAGEDDGGIAIHRVVGIQQSPPPELPDGKKRMAIKQCHELI